MPKRRLFPLSRKSGVTRPLLAIPSGRKFSLDEFRETTHRLENLGGDFVICNNDAKVLFQCGDHCDHGSGIKLGDRAEKRRARVEMPSPVFNPQNLAQYALDLFGNAQWCPPLLVRS
jgi:hypothetical protein